MNKFVEGLKNESNWTTTENGAYALKSTTSSLVDLFGTIGALRSRSESEIVKMFSKAFSEDMLLATKMSFYARNVRGGLGERRTAREIWKFLAINYPDIMRKNIEIVPLFGRYDDLYEFVGTPVEADMWKFMVSTYSADVKNMSDGKPISLLAKWMKSINTSSDESKRLGRLTAKHLGLSYDEYRKTLSRMRKYIDVTERKMSAKEWDKINYPAVPSRAMNIYRNAFRRNDTGRFEDYISNVSKGEAKINSSTLYPYDIVEKYMSTNNYCYYGYSNGVDSVLEEQWKALPNYVDDNSNILIMADVSGSMRGRPMATSVGLAIYFAERNNGDFHNMFMTFSGKPELVEIKGRTLYEKVHNAMNAHWQMNTNIEAAFKLVLNAAVRNKVPVEDMPKSIIVISDMEFDECSDARRWTFYDAMKNEFASYGYEIPNIVFWNVDSRHDTFHTQSNYKGVQLASGQSTSVFKSILKCVDMTPYDTMIETLSDPMYDCVRI